MTKNQLMELPNLTVIKERGKHLSYFWIKNPDGISLYSIDYKFQLKYLWHVIPKDLPRRLYLDDLQRKA